MRLSVLIYGVTTVDIATSAGRKDDEPKGRTVKPTAKSVRTATVCRDEVRFRPEHQCLPERQPGRHLQHTPACTATLWQEHDLYVAFRLLRDTNARSGGCLREQRNGSSQRRPTSAGAPARVGQQLGFNFGFADAMVLPVDPLGLRRFNVFDRFARSRGRHANSGFAVSRELGAKDAQLALSQIVELFWQRGLWNARDLFYYAETSIELR